MQKNGTAGVIEEFNRVFLDRDPAKLKDLIAPDCVMESIQPAPDGTRYVGYDACLAFWEALASDTVAHFEVEETHALGDRATICWRLHFGDGQSLRGVNLMHVREGRIVEALGYSKLPGKSAPLPD